MKRNAAAAIALAALILTSGCIGFLQGNEALSFEASPATVDDATLDDTGYGDENLSEVSLNKSIEFQNESREVRVTNWNAMYTKSVSVPGMGEQEAARFITFSTPQFKFAGQSLNPVGNMSNEELLDSALSEKTSIGDVETVKSERVHVLGQGANVTKFRASVNASGDYLMSYETDVYLHVTKVAHGDDYVVLVGVYPVQLDEEQEILTLMKNIEHES